MIDLHYDPQHGKPLPTGAEAVPILVDLFDAQLRETLDTLATRYEVKGVSDVPDQFADYAAWNERWVERMLPPVERWFDFGGTQAQARLGGNPWDVRVPNVQQAVREAAFKLSASANRTTQERIDAIVPELKRQIAESVELGDTGRELRRRVENAFAEAKGWRAERIARTWASRATHEGQLIEAEQSGVVVGKQWLVSADACPICQAIAAESANRLVALRESFARVGNHPDYADVQYPPAHPNCACSITEVFIYSGKPVRADLPRPEEPVPEPVAEPPVEPTPPKGPPPLPPDWTGPSSATVDASFTGAEKVQREIDELFGKHVPVEEMASIIGAPDDATVRVESGGGVVFVKAEGKGWFANRRIQRVKGRLEMYNEEIKLDESLQGQGLGLRIFSRQVENASRLGVERIECFAARSDGGRYPKFGYKVWPRFGYDRTLPDEVYLGFKRGRVPRAEWLPDFLKDAKSVSDIFATEKGRAWWRENGVALEMSFDLDDGSRSRRVLQEYVAAKRAQGKTYRGAVRVKRLVGDDGVERPDYEPGDLELMDRVIDGMVERGEW